jgi:hypothetical protein
MLRGVSALSRASPAQARAFSTVKLPDLPYDYSALAPAIAPEIMEVGRVAARPEAAPTEPPTLPG